MAEPRSRPVGRRLFVGMLLVGLSGFAWGGIAREETKDALPHTLLPWVLIAEHGDHPDTVPLGPRP